MGVENEIIVGDIGGTNGRFAIATMHDDQPLPILEAFRGFQSAEFQSLDEMLEAYVRDLGDKRLPRAHLAIAGPTGERAGRLTNLGWEVDATSLEAKVGIERVVFLNDFHALAAAAGNLRDEDLLSVKGGIARKNAPLSVMGPGTGFGVSLLVPAVGGRSVVPTEGGHMRFAPVTRLEMDLCESLSKGQDHISIETLLCGRGLQRIHQFIVEYGGAGDASLRPDQITAAASSRGEPSCVRAVELFLSILGSAAGDIALSHGARGGVFLGGGILPKISSHLEKSDFNRRFESKGPMQEYLEQIPVDLIASNQAALIGAALCAASSMD